MSFRSPFAWPQERRLPAHFRLARPRGYRREVPFQRTADAIVPVELVDDRGGSVVISEAVVAGQHVRPRGGDILTGAVVAAAGVRLGAAQIGALAATGVDEVVCSKRPQVAVLATGSELRSAGDVLSAGQIYESNRGMVATVLTRANAEVDVLPVVADDADAHRDAIARGLEADVLVTSGGVSMGEHDLVRRIASDLGVREVFWGVSVKPGKPLSFGVRERTLVFGLPGNPVSTLVGALVFVTPALLALQGASNALPRYVAGRHSDRIAPKSAPRRVRPRGSGRRRRRGTARSDRRSGVAHDRARGCGGRTRARAARRR